MRPANSSHHWTVEGFTQAVPMPLHTLKPQPILRRKPKSMPRTACTPHMFSLAPQPGRGVAGAVNRCRQQVLSQQLPSSVLLSAETSRSVLRQQCREEDWGARSRAAWHQAVRSAPSWSAKYVRRAHQSHRLQCRDCQQLQPKHSNLLGGAWQRGRSCNNFGTPG